MNPDHLVQVFVHKAGGGGRIGTAYPVAPGRLLTAKHVLHPEKATGAIDVCWVNLDGAARTPRPAEIEWEGGQGADAAVLRCEFPPGFAAAPDLISRAQPPPGLEWSSAGFVKAGASKGPTPLAGEIQPLATDPRRDGTFELGVDYAATSAEDWLGASGSPVFVGQRILGVVAFTHPTFAARRLTATATCHLLEDPRFRAAIGYAEPPARLERLHGEVVAVLSQSPEATACLALELGIDPRKVTGDAAALARVVVDRLLEQPLDGVLRKLNAAQRKLFDGRSTAAARLIWSAACPLMPALREVARVEVRQWPTSGHSLLVLPAATETLAEIILAGADGRAARFRLLGDVQEPELKLPVPPWGGETAGSAWYEKQWHDQLIERFVTNPRTKRMAPQEEKIRIAAKNLKLHAENNKERYYYIIESKDMGQAAGWEAVVARLQQHYQDVVFVALRDCAFEDETEVEFHVAALLKRASG